jgi:hypothetical protein
MSCSRCINDFEYTQIRYTRKFDKTMQWEGRCETEIAYELGERCPLSRLQLPWSPL